MICLPFSLVRAKGVQSELRQERANMMKSVIVERARFKHRTLKELKISTRPLSWSDEPRTRGLSITSSGPQYSIEKQ